MAKATYIKLLGMILAIIALLYISGPMAFVFAWQCVHGRQANLRGVELHLDEGWIVFHDALTRIPDGLFLNSSEEAFISVHPVAHCITDKSIASTLNHLRLSASESPAASFTYATIRISNQQASCVIVAQGDKSGSFDTACISPGRGNILAIHDTLKYQAEAVHILNSVHETQPCKP